MTRAGRTWGYAKLSDLIAATTLFDVDKRGTGKAKVIYVRDNRRQPGGKRP